jgi:hypothetical protein
VNIPVCRLQLHLTRKTININVHDFFHALRIATVYFHSPEGGSSELADLDRNRIPMLCQIATSDLSDCSCPEKPKWVPDLLCVGGSISIPFQLPYLRYCSVHGIFSNDRMKLDRLK